MTGLSVVVHGSAQSCACVESKKAPVLLGFWQAEVLPLRCPKMIWMMSSQCILVAQAKNEKLLEPEGNLPKLFPCTHSTWVSGRRFREKMWCARSKITSAFADCGFGLFEIFSIFQAFLGFIMVHPCIWKTCVLDVNPRSYNIIFTYAHTHTFICIYNIYIYNMH